MKSILTLILCGLAPLLLVVVVPIDGFSTVVNHPSRATLCRFPSVNIPQSRHTTTSSSSRTSLASTADLGIVALVAGQENYGLAIVALGEALWSFAQSPNFSNIKVLVPASIAAIILVVASGPMITSGEVTSVQYGLEIATITSLLLGASYIARLVAPYSPTAKEAAFVGLLIAIAGFFSFSQNLVVDGFITLPNLPSLPLPEMPLGLGESINTDRY
jgi:hypothetical protein